MFPVPSPGVADKQYVTAIHANDRTQSEPHKGDNRRQGRISYKFIPKTYVSTTPNTQNFIEPKKILYTDYFKLHAVKLMDNRGRHPGCTPGRNKRLFTSLKHTDRHRALAGATEFISANGNSHWFATRPIHSTLSVALFFQNSCELPT